MAGGGLTKILAMKLKTLLLCVLNALKRALCIFRKRAPPTPVLPVVVADSRNAVYDMPEDDGASGENDAASWDSWGTDFQAASSSMIHDPIPNAFPMTSSLPLSTPSLPAPLPPQPDAEEEKEQDYFADMTPATFKAPKIVVKKKASPFADSSSGVGTNGNSTSGSLYSNRLAVSDNASDGLALAPPQELEAMDDWDQPMGEENMWADEENEELDWEVEYALRETRRQELERKKWEQQQRRMQREMQKARTHSQSSSSHFQTIQSLSH